ncbi:MAG: Midasin, partial [Kiritimatiellae bacterium]|nr:Midasin [Kiritimatiellia bacterium]
MVEQTDDDASVDPDGDGLTNAQECEWGTNPRGADENNDGVPDGQDTDGDCVSDGVEVGQGSDPADATDG